MSQTSRRLNLDEQARVGTLTTPIIADHAVTAIKLADGAVTGVAIADGTITPVKLSFAVDDSTLEITTSILRVKSGGITPSHLNLNADVDFKNHQALSFRFENVVSDPVAGHPGRVVWRTDLGQARIDDGTSFNVFGGHVVAEDGTPLTQRNILNFIGPGVTAADSGTETTVTIPGFGGITYTQDQFIVTNPADHNFTLSNVPMTDSTIVMMNGLVLTKGLSNDYTISGSTITLVVGITLTVGDQITILYTH
jgi:hypothetical protein